MQLNTLDPELRMLALGLPIPPLVEATEATTKRGRGRPPVLSSLTERIRVAQARRATANSLARLGQTTRNPKLVPILKRIGRLQAKGALPGLVSRLSMEVGRLSKEADSIGRFHSTEVLPPAESERHIDKLVAKQLAPQFPGLTERMVRSVGADKGLEPFLAQPLWVPSEWERECARQFSIIRRARGLLTPEYLAKIEVTDRDGHLTALDDIDRVSLTAEQYRKAREFQSHCYALGIGSNVLTAWGGREWWEDSREVKLYEDLKAESDALKVERVLSPPTRGGSGGRLQNLALSKIGREDDYNRAIIARVGLPGLKFLRAALWEYGLTDAGWTLGASSPEEARHLAVNLLRLLLDRISLSRIIVNPAAKGPDVV